MAEQVKKPLTYIHVFAGIDALGVAKPEWKPVAFSEIESFPCAVLAHHYPNIPNLGDITQVDWSVWKGKADIYSGGSPCQAFSIAGLRKSLQDNRGNLTLEYIRGFNESECPLGLWENVPGVLTTDDNAFGLFVAGMVGESFMLFPDDKQAERWLEAEFSNTILRCYLTLVDFRFGRVFRRRYPKIKWGNAGMVFGPKGSFGWRVLDAQYFSLPQRRERVFGIAFRPRNAHRLLGATPGTDLTRFLGLPGAILFEPESVPRHIASSRQAREKATAAPQRRTGGESGDNLRRPSTPGGMDGSACACDRRGVNSDGLGGGIAGSATVFGGGNSQSLTVATTLCSHGQRNDFESESIVYESIGYNPIAVSPTLDARCKDGPIRNQQAPFVACFQQNSRHELRLIDGDGQLAGALTAEPGMTQQNYLAFSYKDYGDDAGVISPTLRSGGFKESHANSGAPPAVVIKIDHTSSNGWGVLTDGTSHTLGGSADAVAYSSCLTPWDYQRMRVHNDRGLAPCLFNNGDGGGNEVPSVFSSNILRRFSPTECLRLQGFPDNHLNITYRGKPAFNGPKYRAIGNSWAVNVARWVGDRVELVLDAVMQKSSSAEVKKCTNEVLTVVVGVDESKRGSYFGPLVAVAYVVDEGRREELWQALACNGAFTDSKELSKKQRRALLPLLRECGTWRVGYAKSSEIDTLGTNVANNLAFKRAIAKLPISPTKVLVDGNRLIPNLGIEQIAIPGGDTKELAIAAASILCKEFSDDLVERLGANLPHNFTSHHGYSCDADLERYGAAHRQFRRRFSSVKRVLKETNLMVASLERTSATAILPEVLQVLQGASVEGNTIKLNAPQLDRKLYMKVNDALERIGGTWKGGKVSAHVFESDPTELLQSLIESGSLPKKNPLAFFATPEPLAKKIASMVKESSLKGVVLEPSAGEGALALALRAIYPGAEIDCVEVDLGRAKKLKSLGFDVVGQDFLAFQPEEKYSLVLMNPPFTSDGDSLAYITHIEKAYSLLDAGGELIAIAPNGIAFNNQKRVQAFRNFVQENGGWEELDANAFASSGIGVSTVLIKLEKKSTEQVSVLPAVTVEQAIQDNSLQVAQSSTSFYEMRDRAFKFEILEVHPDLIDLGLGTQCRSKESKALINEWAVAMKEGDWDIDCQEPYHEYPELVAGEEGTFFPLSHHRAQAAKASQTTLKYKVWLPNGANLPFARILAATSNPQKNQPWQSADQPKRVNTVLDNWDLMTDALKDEFIEALDGLLEDQQMTRLKNSRKLSDYVLATVLGMPHRTAAYHRKIWENQKKVKDSGIKVGDRVSVIAPLKNFAAGEAGTVADVNPKNTDIWVAWDGQPGQAPFPIPLAHLQQSNEPKPAILHFSGLVDLLVAVNGDGWNKDVLVEHKETGVDFEGYHARYSSLDRGYWFVTPNDQGLAELVEKVKQARAQLQAVKDQATADTVLPEVESVDEGEETVSEFDEQTSTTPEQYAQAQTEVPPLEPLPYSEGEVVMVKFNKTFGAIAGLTSLGVVRKVEELRCIIYLGRYQVEHAIEAPSIKKVPENQQQEVKEMHDKIDELCKYELDPVDLAILEQLSRQTEYSDRAYRVLASIEREYEGTELKRAIEEFRN